MSQAMRECSDTPMPKNIVICCDGTGNEVSARSNKRTPLQAIPSTTQAGPVAAAELLRSRTWNLGYPAARTFTKFSRLRGLATGYGLEDNIKDAYLFLMRNYEEHDRVFLFGFSRGAYTVRALSGMLFRIGLLEAGNDQLAEHAIKRYFERVRKTGLARHGQVQEDLFEALPGAFRRRVGHGKFGRPSEAKKDSPKLPT